MPSGEDLKAENISSNVYECEYPCLNPQGGLVGPRIHILNAQ